MAKHGAADLGPFSSAHQVGSKLQQFQFLSIHGNCRQTRSDTMSIEMIETDGFHAGTLIKVIGVGGGGSNARLSGKARPR